MLWEKWNTNKLEKSRNRQMNGNKWVIKTEQWAHETPKYPITSNDTKSVIQGFATMKSPGLDGFTAGFTTFL